MVQMTYISPSFSFSNFAFEVIIASSLSVLWKNAVPKEEFFGISWNFLLYFTPLFVAIGVWFAGNIADAKEKGTKFKYVLLSAFITLILDVGDLGCFIAAFVFENFKTWRRNPPKKLSFKKRILRLSLGCLFLFSLWSSYLYFNADMESNGQTVKFRDAVHNFLTSPMFREFKQNVGIVLSDFWHHGYRIAYLNMLELLDPLGKDHSLKVLGLPKNATQEEIHTRFKKLSKEWHPDRHKDLEMKKTAEEKFIEIAGAYEKLSNIRKKRRIVADDDEL